MNIDLLVLQYVNMTFLERFEFSYKVIWIYATKYWFLTIPLVLLTSYTLYLDIKDRIKSRRRKLKRIRNFD
jgi:hypothetical protein